jgi:hypothetical protein
LLPLLPLIFTPQPLILIVIYLLIPFIELLLIKQPLLLFSISHSPLQLLSMQPIFPILSFYFLAQVLVQLKQVLLQPKQFVFNFLHALSKQWRDCSLFELLINLQFFNQELAVLTFFLIVHHLQHYLFKEL